MRLICQTCMHHCRLEPGQTGMCGARWQEDGTIKCGNYGEITALALDPIEKKPLRMFYPGSMILSVGSYGCNLKCPFCQNYEISDAYERAKQRAVYLSPERLVQKAKEYERAGNIGVAFTYNEPLVGWEYVRDTAKLVKEAGMKTVLVTNGTASQEVLDAILPYIDAMNIDLKAFREEVYRDIGGDLETVKAFIQRATEQCHVELTTLIVPGMNDDEAQMQEQAAWMDPDIPLHVTRFFPRYHMTDRPATEVSTVRHLADIAANYVKHVFIGNC